MSIEIQSLSKSFGNFPAVHDVDLHIETGELVALLGPSGSGKTTILRMIAGLEFPDEGSILFDGKDVTHASAYKRKAGFVFQSYALFNHMTVFENIAFGLRVMPGRLRPSHEEIRLRVHDLLEAVQLPGLELRLPAQLSGGQRQRVAFARALAIQPSVLLLDEPFGALDARVRKDLRKWLRDFHDSTRLTTLFVTHDQDEAFEVADRVAILQSGRLQQVSAPHEIMQNPSNEFVRGFLGLAPSYAPPCYSPTEVVPAWDD